MSGTTCTYTSGGTTVSAYCEDGCCSDGCCTDSDTDEKLIAIIIASVIGGLILLFLLALLLWCVLRNSEKDKKDKKPLTKTSKGKGNKFNKLESGNKRTVAAGYAPTQSYMLRHKKKPVRPRTDPNSRNKMTQTINHRGHPGDIIIKSKGMWVSEEGGERYEAYMRSERVREFGTATDGTDTPHRVKRKWNSTANYYTRRDSLKGSSEEDDTLSTFRSGDGRVREGVAVNAYGYAVRDVSKTNYVITEEEKKKKAVQAWQTALPPWQPHSKSGSTTNSAERRWKESMVYVQSQRNT